MLNLQAIGRAQRSQQFQQVLLELTRTDDNDWGHLCRLAGVRVADALEVDRVGIWLFTPDYSAILCAGSYHRRSQVHDDGQTLRVADFPRYFAYLRENRTLAVSDAQTDPRTAELTAAYLHRFDIHGMLDVPIRRQDRLIGILCHEDFRIRDWTSEEIEFVASVADRIALALEATRRREAEADLRRANETLEAKVAARTNELQQSEERYRQLLELLPIGVCISRKGRVDQPNAALATMLGFASQTDLAGQAVIDLFSPEERPSIEADFQVARSNPQSQYLIPPRVRRCRSRGGKTVDVEITSAVTAIAGDRVGVHVVQDVSRRLESEREILRLSTDVKRRAAELATANADLKAFTYSVSHDLRAPLRAITGFSQILTRRHADRLDAQGRHYLDNIIEASTRMSRQIDGLLAYARLGRQAVIPRPVELSTLFAGLSREFAPRLREVNGELHVASPLPAVMGDSTILGQLFGNLLDNALKYRRREVAPRVCISAESVDSIVRVTVADNGIGIAPEHHAKIFQVFQRLHSEEEYSGAGIGLASAKKSADLLAGSIRVESELGSGSRFIVELPAASTESS